MLLRKPGRNAPKKTFKTIRSEKSIRPFIGQLVAFTAPTVYFQNTPQNPLRENSSLSYAFVCKKKLYRQHYIQLLRLLCPHQVAQSCFIHPATLAYNKKAPLKVRLASPKELRLVLNALKKKMLNWNILVPHKKLAKFLVMEQNTPQYRSL